MPYNDPTSLQRRIRGLQNRLGSMRNTQATLTTLTARKPVMRMAVVNLGALAIGSSDQTVTWSSPMPSAVYDVDVNVASALLGKATAVVKSKTASGCVITVTATTVLVAGGLVSVLAVAQTS